MESTRPELDRKVGAQQKGSNCIGDHQMAALHRSILIGGISTSRSNVTSKSSEELAHFGVVTELTALVHENIFSGASWSMFLEEISEAIDMRGFRDSCIAVFHP